MRPVRFVRQFLCILAFALTLSSQWIVSQTQSSPQLVQIQQRRTKASLTKARSIAPIMAHIQIAKGRLFNDQNTAPAHRKEPPHTAEMEVTVLARADAEHVRITVGLGNGCERQPKIR